MSLVTISDIHIKENDDESSLLLQKFFQREEVSNSKEVYFLGDIFDLMIGPHDEYIDKYSIFFNGVKDLIESGVVVYYFSGNHDFHLEKLFDSFLRRYKFNSNQLIYKTEYLIKEIYGEKVYFSHGDELDLDSSSYRQYKKYKNFITSKPLSFLANKVIPYKFLTYIGENASKASRNNNDQKYTDPDSMKEIKASFRLVTEKLCKNHNLNYVICGHSHLFEDHLFEGGGYYLNNGYLLKSKGFFVVNASGHEFIQIR